MKTLKLIAIAVAVMLLVATTASAIAQNQAGMRYSQISKWHGFQLYGDEYVHPGVEATVRGIDVKATSHLGEQSSDIQHWDTSVGYNLPIEGLIANVAYGYLILPTAQDAQEISLTVGLPGEISPRYTISHVEIEGAPAGEIHTFGADMFLGDPDAVSAKLSADITYNQGVNPIGPPVCDFTHVTAGIVLDIPMQGFTLQPGVMYQHAFEPDALNCQRNEVWYSMGVQYAF
jgi:hypothetical protein